MKSSSWITPLGSFILLASSIFHATGYDRLVHRIEAAGLAYPLDGILKASWLLFSLSMFFLAVIAFLAHGMNRGGRIVVLCGTCTGIGALILLRFLGAFLGVYLLAAVTLLLALGGMQQAKSAARQLTVL